MEVEGLKVRGLFYQTYVTLDKRYNPREIKLSEKVFTEIADDSDGCRASIGYMGYDKLGLFNIGRKNWAIGVGEKCGGYSGDEFDSDMLALEFSGDRKTKKQIQNELNKKIKQSSYFKNSLVFGRNDGELVFSRKSRFGRKLFDIIEPKSEEFIAQKPEYNRNIILLSTFQYPATKIVLYKREFAGFLANSIEAVLK